ncbi:response regulator transcription factor [Gordonia desulfuricans]|uniref:Response regulator transcription factor n=1 Tax=Gordonia desulfuricans TaxID=89051 RepID=A0A7K3LV59_9ACTN|nr:MULTISPECIES: response regulator transcription factor [Gordonia]KOY49152.1 transcriptional regulator [Gordonia sp. NB41Y]NDK92134.1 response regulator transcription factor [Gordonia desulfuricans]WLP89333.1 response regulator transcription factor [Gordonia sp. NB41Y]
MNATVLVIEDSTSIRVALTAALTDAGHRVIAREDGARLEHDLHEFAPDVVLLDVMLPGSDGFTLLDVVRRRSDAGIMMVTARDAVADRLHGLTEGADDYITKPFEMAELVARVGAVLRRRGAHTDLLYVDDLVIDQDQGVATRAGTPLALTPTEFRVLCFLAQRRDRVVTKTQILTGVWGYDHYDPNLVEVNVSALRRKLEAHGPRLLQTERGRGYTLRPAAPDAAGAATAAGRS